MPYHWNNDLFNLGHCYHCVLGTTFWMEGSQFWTSSQWRKNMYSQPGFGLPDFCHHVHILHSSGDYLASLLEDFYDSQNEVKKKDGRKGTSRLFIKWCRYVKYKCLHHLNNKKSFLNVFFLKEKYILCTKLYNNCGKINVLWIFYEQKIPINNKMAPDLILFMSLPSKVDLIR